MKAWKQDKPKIKEKPEKEKQFRTVTEMMMVESFVRCTGKRYKERTEKGRYEEDRFITADSIHPRHPDDK